MINKTLIALAVGSVLTVAAGSVSAALPVKAQLQLDDMGERVSSCTLDTVPPCSDTRFDITSQTGSYFDMGGGRTALGPINITIPTLGGVRFGVSLNSSGTHSGAPNGSESPLLDKVWLFASNTGLHGIGTPITISGGIDGDADGIANLDYQGWFVTWNGIPVIAMGGCQFGDPANNGNFSGCDTDQSGTDNNVNTGIATVQCYTTAALRDEGATGTAPPPPDGDCSVGNFYLLDHFANVPAGDPSGFGGAGYALHLEGVIADTNLAPVATNDPLPISMAVSTTQAIDLAANVTDPDGDGVDAASCTVTYTGTRNPVPIFTPTVGVASDCSITYLDNDGTATTVGSEDTFTYTIADSLDKVSDAITVSVTLAVGNVPPIANPVSVVIAIIDDSITVDVAANATDGDGTIDIATVVASNPRNGTIGAPDASGNVTFTPDAGYTGSAAGFDYTVNDNSGDTSNVAAVSIRVNTPPKTNPPATPVSLNRNTDLVIKVSDIASDADSRSQVDPDGLDYTITSATDGVGVVMGTTAIGFDASNVNIITYTPTAGELGDDSFDFTVTDKDGVSTTDTYNLTVFNVPPVAFSDVGNINIDTAQDVTINVLTNDRDEDGTLVVTSVEITTQPANGTATVLSTGEVVYTPDGSGFVGIDPFFYRVSDNDGAPSNITNVDVLVSGGVTVMHPASFMILDTGNVVNPGIKPDEGDGSWFSMQLEPEPRAPKYTSITGFDHLQLGGNNTAQDTNKIQPATSKPIVKGIDDPWDFAGNLGLHKTNSPVKILVDDGVGNVVLDFSGWAVDWNGIPFILGFGPSNGLATVTCAVDCSFGDTFILDYSAQVPKDAKNFANVNYILHLEGRINDGPECTGECQVVPSDVDNIEARESEDGSFSPVTITPGDVANEAGKTTGTGLTSGQVTNDPQLNPNDGEQCVGGCVDFVVSGFSGDYVNIVFRLSKQLPEGAFYRKSINGKWSTFDTSQGDLLGSASVTNDMCPQAHGQFENGLRAGAQCIYLRIFDGGPNDADGVKNGTIVDPSGALLAGSPNVPASGSDGCSMSSTPVSLTQRSDWLLVVAFLALVALRRKKGINV